MSLYSELKRRNVFRVAIAYLALAWLLIEVAGTLFPGFGVPDWAFRFVVIVLVLGFVPALLFSWAYEITPEGIKREKDVVRDESMSHITAKRLDGVTIVLIAAAVIFIVADRFWLAPRQAQPASIPAEVLTDVGQTSDSEYEYPPNSIAVLPFVNMSDDPGNEYFSDGISEELLNLLAKIPNLRVISRTSAFSLKNTDLGISEIANHLSVSHILEGSVRKIGDRVRITAKLIEAHSDTQLWSETYGRTLDDIFAIQGEIAAMVVGQLKITMLDEFPTVDEANPDAYALYLQARYLGRQLTTEGIEQSNALYQQALAIEPDYAAAWAGLAFNYRFQAGRGLRPLDEGFESARDAARNALAIDIDYASAHATLGRIAMLYDNDLSAAARHFKRALELEPVNLDIIGSAAALLSALGRLDEAIALNEYREIRDPVNPVGHYNGGIFYFCAGRWDDAIASFLTALQLSPDMIGAHFFIGKALLFKGDTAAAHKAMQREGLESYRLMGLAMTYHSLGQKETSERILAEEIDKHGDDAAYNIAYVLAWRNEPDRAFRWLEKAVEYGDPGLMQIALESETLFNNIRNDPRWLPFLERIGHSPEQLEAIKFEVTLPR